MKFVMKLFFNGTKWFRKELCTQNIWLGAVIDRREDLEHFRIRYSYVLELYGTIMQRFWRTGIKSMRIHSKFPFFFSHGCVCCLQDWSTKNQIWRVSCAGVAIMSCVFKLLVFVLFLFSCTQVWWALLMVDLLALYTQFLSLMLRFSKINPIYM